MNNIITIYELLKLIKENKDLPKKIKYGNDIYVLQENPEDYATWLYDNLDLLNDVILGHFNIEDAIYLELEILEEENKIPEKLDISNFPRHNNSLKKTAIKLNEIIDYLKSKGDE